MKKVLTLAYFYPPYDTTAAVEASKLTHHLRDFGWDPFVIAAKNDYPDTLAVEIEPGRVVRTRQIDVNRLPKMLAGEERVAKRGYVVSSATKFGRITSQVGLAYRHLINFPDGQVGWYPFAVRAARHLIASAQPSAILSIAWPVTTHMVAARLKKDTRLPWLADFRDLWTDNHHFKRIGPLRKLERSLELRTMRHADAVSTPSERWTQHVENLYGKKAYTVPNAFEPADYPDDVKRPERFTLTYTGVLYPGSQNIRPLVAALKRLKEQRVIDAANFRLLLVGRYVEQLRGVLDDAKVTDLTEISATVPHDEALRLQAESTALLFLLWTQPEGIGWLSAKAYEYLGARRPVLAIGPADGSAAELLRSVNGCVVASDSDAVEKALRSWIDDYRTTGDLPALNKEDVERFEWKEAARELARGLDEISNR